MGGDLRAGPVTVLVTADDRTGALEVGGGCAEALGLAVTVHGRPGGVDVTGDEIAVVDLDCRHRPAATAAARTAAAHRSGGLAAHKIDSTLRGNWAAELRALAARRPVLLVPASPGHGRMCVGGVVLDGGRPVHLGPAGSDARTPVRSSRPDEHLRRAGVSIVVALRGADDVARWLDRGPVGVAVCDADGDGDLDACARLWSDADAPVVLAGPAAVVVRGVTTRLDGPDAVQARRGRDRAPGGGPVVGVEAPVVVCGSLHPAARRQLDRLRELRPDVAVVTSPLPDTSPVSVHAAAVTGARLAADPLVVGARGLVVIGGDTAAQVLGQEPVSARGLVTPGVPWLVDARGRIVAVRSGGFDDDEALVRLVDDLAGVMAGRMTS